MKKSILIIIGTLIILLVVSAWMYLFIFGTPKNTNDVFTRFGFGDKDTTQENIGTPPTVAIAQSTVNTAPQKLKQLTTRPVAGATFITNGIRYVEQGTGHVYEINLTSGVESLISGTTITGVADALFSENAEYVALTTYTTEGSKTIVGKITGSGSIDGVSLPLGAVDISFSGTATNTLLYRTKENDGSTGFSYGIVNNRGTQLFKIPLRDVRMLWGNPIYVYTTPTATQRGYIYKVVKNDLVYVAPGKFGLSGIPYDTGIVITAYDEALASIAYTEASGTITLPLTLIAEKCTQNSASVSALYCAVPTNIQSGTFPDDWYKGVVSYSDILWNIHIADGQATVVSNFLSESGREIDVVKIGTNAEGALIYFINKNDNTLWMFDAAV